MRHRQHRHKLGVKKEHRIALVANLCSALLTHGSIRTTLAKAKALRPFAEKIITMAKHASASEAPRRLYLFRLAISRVRDISAVRSLFNERVSEFSDRPGGYTRIYKLPNRTGDAAEMALIELIKADDKGYSTRSKRSDSVESSKAIA